MRHGQAKRRQRNRGNVSRRGKNQRTQVFDSNGPDVRIRGTAHQVCEKYLALAKDAQSSDDQIMYQNYLQHAEHYQRIINSWAEEDREQDNEKQEKDEQESSEPSRRSVRTRKSEGKSEGQDDLGLPSSILGENVDVEPEKDRTPEVAD